MSLQALSLWVGIVSGCLGIGVWFGTQLKSLWLRNRHKKDRKARLDALKIAAESGELAVCIWIGGQSNPQKDVLLYLQQYHPAIKHLLYYQAPASEELADPGTGLRIAEDVRDWVREFGEQKVTRIRFFPAGIVGYPFLFGAFLSNIAPVIVYQKQDGAYVPLYEWGAALKNSNSRTTEPLAAFRTLEVGTGSAISALSAPAAVHAIATSSTATSEAPLQALVDQAEEHAAPD